MMKRVLAAGLLAALVLTVAASVASSAGYTYKSAGYLTFRTHAAALGPGVAGFSGTDASGGYADSTGYSPGANDNQDTTAVFRLPADFCQPSAADSMPTFIVVWHVQASPSDNTQSTFGTGDSLYAVADPMYGASGISQTFGVTNKSITGSVAFGTQSFFVAAPSGSAAGSETMSSTNPRNVSVVPVLGLTREFRVRTYSDGTSATTGAYWVQGEVLYPSCR